MKKSRKRINKKREGKIKMQIKVKENGYLTKSTLIKVQQNINKKRRNK